MKTLRGCALLYGLLFVGVLMALLPSEAAALPRITIDGVEPSSYTTRSCDSGYNTCYIIPTGTYGNWTVGNVSGSNTARLMLQDNNGSGTATDKMRMRGITFQRTGGTENNAYQLVVVMENTYDGASNGANDFQFALTSGGYFVPLPASTISGLGTTRNDRVRLSGVARLGTGSTLTALPGAKDTTAFQTDQDDHGNTSWSFSQTASSVGNCNTTGATANRCSPFIRETMTIDFVGFDKLFLDGNFSNFTTCREQGSVGPEDHSTPVGPHCKAEVNKMQQENDKVLKEEMKSFDAAQATPFIPCEDEYGGGCDDIIIE